MLKFEGKAKVAKRENGETNPYVGVPELDCESSYYFFSLWEKYGKKRIYINDYKGRSVGYIDCLNNNEIVTDNKYVDETAQYFLDNYEI